MSNVHPLQPDCVQPSSEAIQEAIRLNMAYAPEGAEPVPVQHVTNEPEIFIALLNHARTIDERNALAAKHAIEMEAAEQRAAHAEDRLFSYRRHRSANSMALADFIKARAPELWPDYSTLGVNYSYFDEGADAWINPPYHGEMTVLEHRAKDAEKRATELRAKLAMALEALKPFTTWAESEVDAEGWKHPPMRERIVDWFGPSDFRKAHAAYAALTANS